VMPKSIPRTKRIPSGRGSKPEIHSCSSNISDSGRRDLKESSRLAGVVISVTSRCFENRSSNWTAD
jgi:hypothetical protein